MEKSKTLYKKSSTGALMQWNVIVEGNQYWSEYGQVGGKIQTDPPTTCKGKNIGRANETTPDEQASREAQAKFTKQVDIKNYVENPDDADIEVFTTMLAHTYEKHYKKLPDTLMVSPKLDGVRAYTTKEGSYSRNGKQWVSSKYIELSLESFFDEFPNIIVDGELYCHRLHDDFNKIISLARRMKKFTEARWLDVEMNLEYHVFDVYDPTNPTWKASDRYAFIKKHFGSGDYQSIVCIDTEFCTKETFHPIFERYMENGYEGLMMRDPDSAYECKRSYGLQKYKEFYDEEFTIIDIIEGTGTRAGMMGSIVFEHNNTRFETGARGTHEFWTTLWENKQQYVGLEATVRYQNKTPMKDDGTGDVPRFGVMIAIRNYE